MKPYTNKTDRVDTKKVLYSEIKSDVKARKKAKRNEGNWIIKNELED